jgi:acetylornithine deacetylase/succinyl-diaminopimelate desuccinylase-like protein
MNKKKLESIFKEKQDEFIEGWKDFLKFPSISADSHHNSDCRNCAEWLSNHLQEIGFSSELLENSSPKPVVYAERQGVEGSPVILFYGHYDVQPVDPESAWKTPPFAPELRDGRLYARGAQDNKGQVFYTLKAIEALIANGTQLPTIKIIIEGEEECSSGGISGSLDEWSDRLQADILMVHDPGTVRSGNPTITMGLRGIAHISVELRGPDHDLHSGVHGGIAPNPAQGIAELVAGLFNTDGSVAVAGFYDKVRQPTEHERKLAAATPFDNDMYKRMVGTEPYGGQHSIPAVERVGFMPSLDINGIHSGYGGEGMKTVIPSGAIAKISIRLVPDQDPEAVLDAVSNHLYRHVPQGMRLTTADRRVGGPGFRLDPDSEPIKRAYKALDELSDAPVAFLWVGASVPIVTALAAASGAIPLIVGFGHEDDRIHAPNESFSIEQFKSGFLYAALLLQNFVE